MKFRFPGFVVMLCLVLGGAASSRAQSALTADQVIQKAVARGQQDQNGYVPNFKYRKFTLTEQLDSTGKVKERREKVWEVFYRDGLSHATLLMVNGRLPSEDDLKEQADNQVNLAKVLGDAKSAKGDNRENFLTSELAARFDFTLLGQTNLNGRRSYAIAFAPKNPAMPAHKVVERLLNQISGTIWIDAQEFEVARAEVALHSEVNLLGGIVGSLKKLTYTLERTRVADGVWFSTLATGDFQGRKLLDPTHIKTRSQSVNFHRPA